MAYVDCVVDSDYEICTEYPHTIRRKSDGRVVTESVNKCGYVTVTLNGYNKKKHRIIALQFIPNDDPVNKICVDHINKERDDNRIENLRWVTPRQNNLNKSSSKGIVYTYVDEDELPDDLIEVLEYGDRKIKSDEIAYYYSPETDRFYTFNGVEYRILHINYTKTGGAFVYMYPDHGDKLKVYYLKFKKLYDLI